MPLTIIRQDITKMPVDAIVNAANPSLLGSGGVDGAIHRAAGPQLRLACQKLGGCPTGQAKITKGFHLPCRYVIHTVGPVWRGGSFGEKDALTSCYRTSLQLALRAHCETVAFPLISAGAYGYPKDQALRVAVDTIGRFLLTHDLTVFLVVFDKAAYRISRETYCDIQSFIDDRFVESHQDSLARQQQRGEAARLMGASTAPAFFASSLSLEDAVSQLDESFTDMLLRKIDEKGMTDAQCYKKANLDRKLFSKIRKNRQYHPSKPTALALAVALELSLSETKELLQKAGFALSHSQKFDLIVEYFIQKGCYDIFAINEALFAFDQSLLGA
ncbi:MAG TPA: O-acetyl-ADP-ribose deacetylase [Firmicutes bacterium]|nr:O-acetyl-ADP-ribose deacetylase [Bacillota bacterium]